MQLIVACVERPNEAVEKLLEGSRSTFFGGHSTLPEHPIAAYGTFYEVGILERPSEFSRFEFFYSFNVEAQGRTTCGASAGA